MWAALGLAGLAAGLQVAFGPTVVTLSLGPWAVAAALGLAGLLISVGGAQQSAHRKSSRAIGAEEFAAAGLGPVPRGQPAPALYLDLLKRTLINVVYYESSQALWVYGPDKVFRLSDGFELQSRVVGEDMPDLAKDLRAEGTEVITMPIDGISWQGGGFRCWHHPLVRQSTL